MIESCFSSLFEYLEGGGSTALIVRKFMIEGRVPGNEARFEGSH